jgi:O-antigen/teichoic acid export membrane protein
MWGIISSYNKLGSSESAGLYAAGLLITQPMFQLADFNLRQIFVTDIENRWEFRDYFAHRILCSIIALVVSVFLAAFVFRQNGLLVKLALVMGFAITGQSLSDLFHALFQKRERFDLIAKSLIIRGLLSFTGTVAAFYATQSVLFSLVVLAALRFLTAAVYDFPTACLLFSRNPTFSKHSAANFRVIPQEIAPRFSCSAILAMTRLGAPLAINMGLLSLAPQIPRFWLERQGNADGNLTALGQFASIAMLTSVGLMIINSLGVATSQRFAKSYAADRREFLRLTIVLIGLSFGMGCLALLAIPFVGSFFLTLVYNEEYASLSPLLWLITFGATFGFVGGALGYPVTAARVFRIQPFICFVQVLLTTLGCAILVPRFGVFGAAWAVAIANIVHAALFAGAWYFVWRLKAKS